MKRIVLPAMILLTALLLFGCTDVSDSTTSTAAPSETAVPSATPEMTIETSETSEPQDNAVNETVAIPGVIGEQEITEEAIAEVKSVIEGRYERRREWLAEDAKSRGLSEDDPYVVQGNKVTDELEKLANKAYITCGAPFYCEEVINYESSPERVRRQYFDVQKGFRIEESVDGELSFITVFDIASDTHYSYDLKKDRVEKISGASTKGYGMSAFDIDCYDDNRNNANRPDNVFTEEEFRGIPAIKFSYEQNNDKLSFYNAVWFDAERGVLLCELQEANGERFESIFTLHNNLKFDDAIFTFDQSMPSAADMFPVQQ